MGFATAQEYLVVIDHGIALANFHLVDPFEHREDIRIAGELRCGSHREAIDVEIGSGGCSLHHETRLFGSGTHRRLWKCARRKRDEQRDDRESFESKTFHGWGSHGPYCLSRLMYIALKR